MQTEETTSIVIIILPMQNPVVDPGNLHFCYPNIAYVGSYGGPGKPHTNVHLKLPTQDPMADLANHTLMFIQRCLRRILLQTWQTTHKCSSNVACVGSYGRPGEPHTNVLLTFCLRRILWQTQASVLWLKSCVALDLWLMRCQNGRPRCVHLIHYEVLERRVDEVPEWKTKIRSSSTL